MSRLPAAMVNVVQGGLEAGARVCIHRVGCAGRGSGAVGSFVERRKNRGRGESKVGRGYHWWGAVVCCLVNGERGLAGLSTSELCLALPCFFFFIHAVAIGPLALPPVLMDGRTPTVLFATAMAST